MTGKNSLPRALFELARGHKAGTVLVLALAAAAAGSVEGGGSSSPPFQYRLVGTAAVRDFGTQLERYGYALGSPVDVTCSANSSDTSATCNESQGSASSASGFRLTNVPGENDIAVATGRTDSDSYTFAVYEDQGGGVFRHISNPPPSPEKLPSGTADVPGMVSPSVGSAVPSIP
ncbi:MAG TPA: hypothetical protein VMB52_06525 [Verrucomicrobiae bacterium]|nr:hypothetical protein [Verrucomicrobiae bacterium]